MWIINCPFFITVIHAQQRRYDELSHLGTVVRSPPAWKISITSDRLVSPPGSLSPTSILPAPLTQNPDPCCPHDHHQLSDYRLTGEPPTPTHAYMALTAAAKPLTFLPEHGLWQDVAFSLWSRQFGFFNVRPGCAFLQCSHCLLRGSFLSFLKTQVPAAQRHSVITSSHLRHRALFLQQGCLPPHYVHPQRPAGYRSLRSQSQPAGSEQQHSTEGHGPLDVATECDVMMCSEGNNVCDRELCEHLCQVLYFPTPTMSPKDPMENLVFCGPHSGFYTARVSAGLGPPWALLNGKCYSQGSLVLTQHRRKHL